MGYKPPPALVAAVGNGLAAGLRYRSAGLEHVRAAIAASPTRSVVFCLWHQALLPMICRHHHQKIAALTSLSGDGTIVAEYMRRIGLRPVRGSSSRGGLRAARELIAAVQEGWHAAITVDGPRGPYKEVKPGPFEIARRTGAPIVPVAVRASLEVEFKRSWDRFRLPLPGARVALAYGEPMAIPPEYPSPDDMLRQRRRLGAMLLRLEAWATLRVGGTWRPPPARVQAWFSAVPGAEREE